MTGHLRTASTDPSHGAAWPARGAVPLVERAPQLEALRGLLLDTERGHGATRIVLGEGGVGKTRLIGALSEEATSRGFTVVTGRAYPVETGIPYALFADAFLPLLRGMPAGQLNLLTRGGLPELAQLFPALESPMDRGSTPSRGDAADSKARLLWTFAHLLTKLSAQRPMLVVLENLQWADGSSLELLHFAARQLAGQRVAFVASYNSAERDGNETLLKTEQSLVGLGVARTIEIAPLSEAGTCELVRRIFDIDSTAAELFARRLHERTAGNPYFVEETLKALVEAGRLERRAGVWVGWEVEEFGLPRTVRDAVLARLSGLTADARRGADLMAVLGARVTHEALCAVMGLSSAELLPVIDELRRRNVLSEWEEAGSVAYDFTHPTLRDVLYRELGLARARTLHAAVAELLERHWGDAAADHADELAYHFSRADTSALAVKAMRYLERAGESAAARHASREAADYLDAARAIAERERSTVDVERIAGVLARVRQRLGDYDGAVTLWKQLRESARARGDDRRLAEIQRSLGLAAFWTGRFADALLEYDGGIAAAERVSEPATHARLLVARGMCFQAIGRGQHAERDVREALRLAESLADRSLSARVHRALLLLCVWTGPADAAREHGERAIALADATGDGPIAWSAHWSLAILAGMTGRAAEVSARLAHAERLAAELRSPLLEAWTAEVAIEYHAGVGEWDVAVALAERTIAVARSLGQRTLLPRLLVWAGLLYFGRGELERGKACVDEAWELSGAERLTRGDESEPAADPREVHSIVPAHIGRAAYHLAKREWQAAIAVGERGLRIAERSGYVAWSIHRLLPIVAEAALWAADHERARALGRRLRQESSHLGHPLGLAWADACDAVQELLKGDRSRSVALLRNACEALEAIPYVADAARLRRQLARALAETGDRDGALRELRTAHGVFERLGAAPELEGTREQMRAIGARPPTRVGPGMAGLTGRELDIVRHVARRRSNKEIGTALGISARTVSTHLSNIFAKLGVGSRGELTDLARDTGLLEGGGGG